MHFPSESEFLKLTIKGSLIPIYKEILGDLETPVSNFYKLASALPNAFLLESAEQAEQVGRYSIIGLPCRKVLKAFSYKMVLEEDKKIVSTQEVDDPLAYVENFLTQYKVAEVEGVPKFNGGRGG